MLRQKKAIHDVPSACRRVPPVGSASDRLKIPMLSIPKNPPSKTLFPSESFRLTHLIDQLRMVTSTWELTK
jgi:hypothetical protein